MRFIPSILLFWHKHPSLFYGLAILLGVYAAIYGFLFILIPLACLFFPILLSLRHERDILGQLLLGSGLFLAAWCYGYTRMPPLPIAMHGQAHLQIDNMVAISTPFGKQWRYQCHLLGLYQRGQGVLQGRIPCTLTLPENDDLIRPAADKDYLINGMVQKQENGNFILKPHSGSGWAPVDRSHSWAESRFEWKKSWRKWIFDQFSDPLAGSFLAGLITGDFDDQSIREQFARFGIQHILAISGFHFTLIAAFFGFLLRGFFSNKMTILIVIMLMSGYAFVLGNNPSVLRAWLMLMLLMAGMLMEKSSRGLNLLGASLAILLLLEPSWALSPAFQLSFLSTGAILLALRPMQQVSCHILPKRSLPEVMEMPLWDQHAYCFLALFREGMALSLAIYAFALPLTLLYFQHFPIWGLLYNLFFPLLATISLFLLLLGIVLYWVPLVGGAVVALNNAYTGNVLKLTYQLPASVDHSISFSTVPTGGLVVYFSVLVLVFIVWNSRLEGDEVLEHRF